MSNCPTCDEARQDKRIENLKLNRKTMQGKGEQLAREASASGYWMALAINRTGYRVELERPIDSSLNWEYICL